VRVCVGGRCSGKGLKVGEYWFYDGGVSHAGRK
jgi:hypothetical protein